MLCLGILGWSKGQDMPNIFHKYFIYWYQTQSMVFSVQCKLTDVAVYKIARDAEISKNALTLSIHASSTHMI